MHASDKVAREWPNVLFSYAFNPRERLIIEHIVNSAGFRPEPSSQEDHNYVASFQAFEHEQT